MLRHVLRAIESMPPHLPSRRCWCRECVEAETLRGRAKRLVKAIAKTIRSKRS